MLAKYIAQNLVTLLKAKYSISFKAVILNPSLKTLNDTLTSILKFMK